MATYGRLMSASVEKALIETLKKPSPMRVFYDHEPKPWPFGTILRHTDRVLREVFTPHTAALDRIMVLRQEGYGIVHAVTVAAGTRSVGAVDAYAMSEWEPDTP